MRVRLGLLLALVLPGVMALLVGSSALAHFSVGRLKPAVSADRGVAGGKIQVEKRSRSLPSGLPASALLPRMMAAPAFFQTAPLTVFASDCTSTGASFNLGDTICVRVGNVRSGLRLAFIDPAGFIRETRPITTSPQDELYTLPTTLTDVVGGVFTVENRGVWRVNLIGTGGAVAFTREVNVKDPAHIAADVSITKGLVSATIPGAANQDIVYDVVVKNYGPDDAASVTFTDATPANTTFGSLTQLSGPTFSCTTPSVGSTGTTTCTITTLPWNGDSAIFEFVYKSSSASGVIQGGDVSVSSTTPDTSSVNNAGGTPVIGINGSTPAACTLDCPNDITVSANATQNSQSGAIVTYNAPDPSGDCGTVGTDPNHPSGSFFPVGTTTVTISSTGGGSCSFNVTVLNSTAPTISCPATINANAGADCVATVDPGAPATTGTGVTVEGVRSDGHALDESYPAGATTITWTATDSFNRSVSCQQAVNVASDDTTAPTITAPDNVTVVTGPDANSCSVNVEETQLGSPVANDNCGTPHVTRTGVPTGNAFPVGTTTITYTATDGAGHTATATQTVTVIDNTPPIINAPADATYTCPNEVPTANPSQATGADIFDVNGNPHPGPVSDNCGTPSVIVSETRSGAGSAASPLVITRTFTATDAAGNSASAAQTITVIDTTPPVITRSGASSVTVECHTSFNDPGATASDNCQGSVPVTVSGSVNVNVPATYTLTYNATDAAGNPAAAVTRTVIVIDTTPPVITLNGASDLTVECHTSYTDAGASAADSCGGPVAVSPSGSVNINAPGNYTLTYTATDPSGNTATATRAVHVRDTTPPVITVVGANPFTVEQGSAFVDPGATANDSCGGPLAVTPSGSVNVNVIGTYTITYTATDPSGNTATATRTVFVIYKFTGFFSPINNLPTLNQVNAGRSIPVKFSLNGNQGLNIFAADYPVSQQVNCSTSAPISDVQETGTAGNSSLSYDASSGQYNYVWKTEGSWAGTCRVLTVKLNDGTSHVANFKFK
jgi:uncharacterized repeat protein (TIGR01451 family)